MLTLWKRIVFSVGSLLSVGSVTLLLVALSTQSWVTASLLCQTGADLVNASQPELAQFTGDLYFGLFRGGKTRRCGLGGRRASVHIFPRLIRKINYGIHLTVILFLFMAIGFALVSLAFCIYNARKVPYQAIKGPLGLYLWNLTAALFCSLALVGFIAAVHHHRLTECVANFREDIFHFVVLEKSLGFSFWLCVASAASHGTNILVVASSRIHMPKIQKKKPEVPTVTGEDLLY